jgi:paraquat-inducible protein B
MNRKASPAMIGGFVVAACGLLVLMIVALSAGRVFRTKAKVIVYFADSVGGLNVGAPVRFLGIEVGKVKDVRINMTGIALDPKHIRIPVLLEIDEDRLRSEGAKLINLRDPAVVQRLVGLGLRAELASEGLLSGVRTVDLAVRPDTPVELVHDPRYPEIPSVRSPTEAIPVRVEHVLKNLDQLDVAGISESLRATIDDADRLLHSPHLARTEERLDAITAELERAVSQAGATARELRPAISSVSSRIDDTLRDVSEAARSLRRLSDELTRDPGAILRGGRP